VLDSNFFIGAWQRKNEEVIYGIFESKEEAEEHLLISKGKRKHLSKYMMKSWKVLLLTLL